MRYEVQADWEQLGVWELASHPAQFATEEEAAAWCDRAEERTAGNIAFRVVPVPSLPAAPGGAK